MDYFEEEKAPISEMNIVPYIDVMLVLLVIFMVTAPLLTQGVVVNLPQAKTEVLPQSEKPPIVISIDKESNFYVNDHINAERKLDKQALEVYLKEQYEKDPKRYIIVRGDKHIEYGQMVILMALLQQLGIKDFGLMTQEPEKV